MSLRAFLVCSAICACGTAPSQPRDSGIQPPGAESADAGSPTAAAPSSTAAPAHKAAATTKPPSSAGAGGNAAASSSPPKGAVAKPAVPAPEVPAAGTAGPLLRVDLDMQGRPTEEVTELGYRAWPVVAGPSLSRSFEGVQLTFAKSGANGSGVAATWSKAAVDAPNYARLGGDGITVDGGDAGATLTLTLSGLPAGHHALLTYHNVPSNVASIAPLDILVDGTAAVTQLQPSIGALANAKVPTAYLAFDARAGKDVVITFQAHASTAASKNVVVNGIELDVPDASKQASDPQPANHDEHVDADKRELGLSWKAAPQAGSHDVYFGDDPSALAHADHQSALFKGNQASTHYDVHGLDSIERYYWRIDELDANGGITQGALWYFKPRQLAFPEAEGYGRFALGGRGGVVVHVTNLDDSGPGSLRDAIETDRGPRTVVFDVGGIIPLASRLSLNQSYVTVAGQTAPGKGICIRAAPFGLTGVHDVIVRDVRVRLGHGMTFDGMGMQGSDHAIFDHCSISWTIDEAFSSRSAKNITLQHTLISECLNVAGHQNYPAGTAHGYAATISGDLGSFHHNLLAHCEGRNWSLGGGLDPSGNFAGRLDIFDNVVYNWGGRTTDGGAHQVNFVDNYYKPGAASTVFTALNAQYDDFPGTQRYYFAGNLMPGHFDLNSQDKGRQVMDGKPNGYTPWVDAPFFPSYAATTSAEEAYKRVLSDVGVTQPALDDHDARVLAETRTGTYKYKGSVSNKPGLPDNEADVGGYEDYPNSSRDTTWDSDADGLPDFWENARKLDPSSAQGDYTEPNLDSDGDGYTELDDYLEWMSRPHAFTTMNKAITIDLTRDFAGYTASPSYTSPEATHGKVTISGDKAMFSPDDLGFASFEIAVTDSEGAMLTRRYEVFVSSGK